MAVSLLVLYTCHLDSLYLVPTINHEQKLFGYRVLGHSMFHSYCANQDNKEDEIPICQSKSLLCRQNHTIALTEQLFFSVTSASYYAIMSVAKRFRFIDLCVDKVAWRMSTGRTDSKASAARHIVLSKDRPWLSNWHSTHSLSDFRQSLSSLSSPRHTTIPLSWTFCVPTFMSSGNLLSGRPRQ